MTSILLVEDDPGDRVWLEDLLRSAGQEVASYASGADALAHFDERGADCVLIDRRLAGEDGMAVMSQLRWRDTICPVIVVTGEVDELLTSAADHCGAAAVLRKSGLTARRLNATVAEALSQATAARARTEPANPGRWQILLVDDSPDDREFLRDAIETAAEGSAVAECATSDEALALLENGRVDCILLDYRLGIEDGLGVLASLRAAAPRVPVIMLTGRGSEEIATVALRAGAADYRVKGADSGKALCDAIRNAILHGELEARLLEQEAERRHFLRTLVHDLRMPLRQVRQLGEDVLDFLDAGDLGEARALIASQREVAGRAEALIRTLGDYALLDRPVEMAPVSLSAAARAARDNLETYIRARGGSVWIDDLPAIEGNAVQLTQLFQNLIENGLKYCQAAAPEVTIAPEPAEGDPPGTVGLVVRDNGIGIEAEYLEEIFAPLKRLCGRDAYEGSGLGLAICKKIVERHGGRIWCRSLPGQGAAFHIRIPQTV